MPQGLLMCVSELDKKNTHSSHASRESSAISEAVPDLIQIIELSLQTTFV